MYAFCPRATYTIYQVAVWPEGRGHTYQAKPECLMLQLICNTYQADSLYREINHPSQYKSSHWISRHTVVCRAAQEAGA